MRYSCEIEDDFLTATIDNCNTYAPSTDKQRKILITALNNQAARTARQLNRKHTAECKKTLDSRLTILHELKHLVESDQEITLTYDYRTAVLDALSNEKKHRKTAHSIALDIMCTPHYNSLEFGCEL